MTAVWPFWFRIRRVQYERVCYMRAGTKPGSIASPTAGSSGSGSCRPTNGNQDWRHSAAAAAHRGCSPSGICRTSRACNGQRWLVRAKVTYCFAEALLAFYAVSCSLRFLCVPVFLVSCNNIQCWMYYWAEANQMDTSRVPVHLIPNAYLFVVIT